MKKSNKILAFAFLAVAVLSLIFAVICFISSTNNYSIGTYEIDNKYGADFYTDAQNAIAQVTANTYYANRIFRSIVSGMFRMGAFAFILNAIVFGALGISKLKTEAPKKEIFEETSETTQI